MNPRDVTWTVEEATSRTREEDDSKVRFTRRALFATAPTGARATEGESVAASSDHKEPDETSGPAEHNEFINQAGYLGHEDATKSGYS